MTTYPTYSTHATRTPAPAPAPSRPAADADEEVFLDAKKFARMLGVSRSTIYSLERMKLIPEPINFGPRLKRWRKKDILHWLENRNKK